MSFSALGQSTPVDVITSQRSSTLVEAVEVAEDAEVEDFEAVGAAEAVDAVEAFAVSFTRTTRCRSPFFWNFWRSVFLHGFQPARHHLNRIQ